MSVSCILINGISSDGLKMDHTIRVALKSAPDARTDAETVFKAWKLLEVKSHIWASTFSQIVKPYLIRILNETKVSFTCNQSLLKLIDGFKNLNTWAFQSKLWLVIDKLYCLI